MADIDYEAQFKRITAAEANALDAEWGRSRTYLDAKKAFTYAQRRESQGHDVAFAVAFDPPCYIVWTNDPKTQQEREDAKLAGLPKWAQNEIAVLKKTIEYLRGQLKGVEEGDTGITWTKDFEHYQNLPEGARVRFRGKDGRYVDVHVDNTNYGGDLTVQAQDTIAIVPVASNTFRIRGAKW